MSSEGRFWPKVAVRTANECWPWTAGVHRDGYGVFQLNGRAVRAHRYAYADKICPIGDLCVCHRCDNPLCCNPAHLFVGTAAVNAADMVAKERQTRGADINTAKLTEAQVIRMRRYYKKGINATALGRVFNIGKTKAWAAVTGRTWKHLPGAA